MYGEDLVRREADGLLDSNNNIIICLELVGRTAVTPARGVGMGKSRAESRDTNRRALLGAARQLVATEGAGVSLDMIARTADLTTGAVYSIFGSKQNLLIALLSEEVERYQQVQVRLEDPRLTLRQMLRGAADAWMTAFDDDIVARLTFELQLVLLAIHDSKLRTSLTTLKANEISDLAVLLTDRVIDPDAPERRTTKAQARTIAYALRAHLSGLASQQLMLNERPKRSVVRASCEALAHLVDNGAR